MDVIAVAVVVFPLVMGAFVLLRERGYSFDLRRRKSKPLSGGRRAYDR
ncbi:hypothetical protein G6O69_15945 [Pseudenhygromyxa sp. WMMC2535]|nr:hypothetical protein [Pseudenhygromyxa sp. WMMC2535]NVB39336.1 hypothetical protein [Pseudenhygromyxa sp. WMMC2535]